MVNNKYQNRYRYTRICGHRYDLLQLSQCFKRIPFRKEDLILFAKMLYQIDQSYLGIQKLSLPVQECAFQVINILIIHLKEMESFIINAQSWYHRYFDYYYLYFLFSIYPDCSFLSIPLILPTPSHFSPRFLYSVFQFINEQFSWKYPIETRSHKTRHKPLYESWVWQPNRRKKDLRADESETSLFLLLEVPLKYQANNHYYIYKIYHRSMKAL